MKALNFNNKYLTHNGLTPENCALLLIDHQTGLMLGVQTADGQTLKNNTLALAQTAKIYNLPVLLTTSGGGGPNGPLMHELIEMFPHKEVINRTIVNAWADPRFVAAVEETGRKKLLIAGITTDVCVAFPAISAVADGYDVYAVVDASGTWNPLVEQAAMLRMSQAGVVMVNWVAVAAELQHDWVLPTGGDLARLYGNHLGPYGYLLNNHAAYTALTH